MLGDSSADLIVVFNALHWFDKEKFYQASEKRYHQ